jgi:hypothetical protein
MHTPYGIHLRRGEGGKARLLMRTPYTLTTVPRSRGSGRSLRVDESETRVGYTLVAVIGNADHLAMWSLVVPEALGKHPRKHGRFVRLDFCIHHESIPAALLPSDDSERPARPARAAEITR